jgi:bifunctional enzyme CysN/CysC
VKRILTMDGDLERAKTGQAVVLQLDTDIDVSRGAILAPPDRQPAVTKSLDARLVWLADEPFSPARGYLLRIATDLVPVAAIGISAHLDLATLTERPAATCAANDLALARIDLGRATVAEPFAEQRETGSFMLIDALTGAPVAGGVVTGIRKQQAEEPSGNFRLTHALLRQGVAADLGHDPAAEEELCRRANEVAILLRGAGVAVQLDNQMASARIDAATVGLGVLMVLSFALVWAIVFGLL